MSQAAPTRFLLVRHGRVDPAWQGRVYGDLDVPLAAHGEEQSRALARRLGSQPLDAVVSSGLLRTEFAAALLREPRGLERRDEPDLREVARGRWRGRRPEEIDRDEDGAFRRWLAAPDRHRPPDGESLTDLAARVRPRLASLSAEYAGGTVALIVHAWVVRVIVCEVLALPLERAPELPVGETALFAVDLPSSQDGGRATLSGFALDEPPPRSSAWFRGPQRS